MSDETYLSFKHLITTDLIKILHVIGIILISLGGLGAIALGVMQYMNEGSASPQAVGLIAGGLMALTAGNILWRILCEGWIIIFSMHELLASVEKRVSSVDVSEEHSRLMFEQLRATESNNDLRHEELLTALRALKAAPQQVERMPQR